jgi:hypothetical protein
LAARPFILAVVVISTRRRLKIGSGIIAPVAREVWAYEVSGKQVLRQWFSYRKKDREKPQIGDRRPPSPKSSPTIGCRNIRPSC